MYILQAKTKYKFKVKIEEQEFDSVYGVLYEDIRDDLPGYLQFYSIYLYRRAFYVILVYYYTHPFFILF